MPSYSLYGVRLDSEHAFRLPLFQAAGTAQLTLAYARAALPEPADGQLVYLSPRRTEAGDSASAMYRLSGGRELLVFPPGGRFLLDGDRILTPRPEVRQANLFEIRFLGAVMAYWLERRGLLALHASAVELDGRAVAFVARHGGGKTSLAATFAACGHRLLTDDLLAVELAAGRPGDGGLDGGGLDGGGQRSRGEAAAERGGGRPDHGEIRARAGYPMMRMDDSLLQRFAGRRSGLRRVHPRVPKWFVPFERLGAGFQPAALPLAAVFLLRGSRNGSTSVSPVGGSEALAELLKNSFSPYLVEAAGMRRARLERLATLVDRLPVRVLASPRGLERLPEARLAVLAALNETA